MFDSLFRHDLEKPRCLTCGAVLRGGEQVCRRCGAELSFPKRNAPSGINCQFCGEFIPEGMVNCPSCGNLLMQQPVFQQAQQPFPQPVPQPVNTSVPEFAPPVHETPEPSEFAPPAHETPAIPEPANVQTGIPMLTRLSTGEKIMICTESFLIGKDKTGMDFPITGNSAVSRRHAEILRMGGEFYIKDLNSTNGTAVNGHPIPAMQNTQLNNGDIINLADEKIMFSL